MTEKRESWVMKAQKLGVLGRPEQGQEERGEESIICQVEQKFEERKGWQKKYLKELCVIIITRNLQ